MKIAVFGGTGRTGRHVITRALADGHEVVAIARRPDAVTTTHERLRVVKGDVLDRASFESALVGVHAVLSCIGPPGMLRPGKLLTEGTRNVVDASAAAGVRRYVYESGMIATDGAELWPLPRFVVRLGQLTVLRALFQQKRDSEAMITASLMEWIIVRPPGLDQSPPKGAYNAGPAAPIAMARMVSHADVADLMVRSASEDRFVRQIVNIGH